MKIQPPVHGYEQLAAQIRQRIFTGADGYRPGDELASTPKMGEQVGISQAVVQRAYALLGSQGLVYGERGVRYYVRELSDYAVTLIVAMVPAREAEHARAAGAIFDAAEADPAMVNTPAIETGQQMRLDLTVRAAGPEHAAVAAVALARAAGDALTWPAREVHVKPHPS